MKVEGGMAKVEGYAGGSSVGENARGCKEVHEGVKMRLGESA